MTIVYIEKFNREIQESTEHSTMVRMMTDGHSVPAQYNEASSDKVLLTNEVKGREDHCARSTINTVMDEEPG